MKMNDMHQGRTFRAMLVLLFVTIASLLMGGCEQQSQQSQGPKYSADNNDATKALPIYRLAVHPLHNPRKLTQAYQPLIDYLNQNIPEAKFQLEASRDYASYESKFRAREAEFLLPNPWQTLEAMKVGYRVMAMAGDAEDFRGIFIVRKDAGIQKPSDLKGKAVSYPSPTALAAAILPQQFLHGHGLDVNRDIENHYVGSQESSIMNVYLRQVTAGATWPPPWRAFQKEHPEEAAQLKVIWETPHLLNNSVMVRDDVPAKLREQARQLFLGLNASDTGRAILANMETARFHPATDTNYEQVRQFISRFEAEVRPVEKK